MCEITLNVWMLIQKMKDQDSEAWSELLSRIVTDNSVIKSIAEQIAHGFDSEGNAGESQPGSLWTTEYPSAYENARRWLKTQAPEALQHEMDRLIEKCKDLKITVKELDVKLQEKDAKILQYQSCNKKQDSRIKALESVLKENGLLIPDSCDED